MASGALPAVNPYDGAVAISNRASRSGGSDRSIFDKPGFQKLVDEADPHHVHVRPTLWQRWERGHFVIHPHDSSFLPWWDSFMFALIVIIAFLVPFEVGFELLMYEKDTRGTRLFLYVVDMICVIDTCLQFLVAHMSEEQKRWERKPREILKAYFKGNFVQDLLSVFPFIKLANELQNVYGVMWRFVGVLSLLGLLRLQHVRRMITRYETRVSIRYAYVNMARLMVLLILTVHLAACAWGFLLCAECYVFGIDEEDTWFTNVRNAKPALFTGHLNPIEIYTASLYWSCMTTTSIGYGDITATNQVEALGATCIMIVTGVIWAYIIGNICAIASSLNESSREYETQYDSLNHWMKYLDLPDELRTNLRAYFKCVGKMSRHHNQAELLRSMSPALQGEVVQFLQTGWINKVQCFHGVKDAGFFVDVFERFQFAVYPPREIISFRTSLCNVQRGLAIRGFQLHGPTSYWGVCELLLSNTELLEPISPVALSFVELQYLTREALEKTCKKYPQERNRIRRIGLWLALSRALTMRKVKPSWLVLPTRCKRAGSSQVLDHIGPLTGGFSDEAPGKPFGHADSRISMASMASVGADLKSDVEALKDRVGSVETTLNQAVKILKELKVQSDRQEARKYKL